MAHLIATIAVRLVEKFGSCIAVATIEKAALRRWKNQARLCRGGLPSRVKGAPLIAEQIANMERDVM
jgi:hypothetical protein